MQCVAPESKPATKIDWIVNESLNLTKIVPNNSVGLQMFALTNRRYTKLPMKLNSDHSRGTIMSLKQTTTTEVLKPHSPSQLATPKLTSAENNNPLVSMASPADQRNALALDVFESEYELSETDRSTGSGPSQPGDTLATAFRAVPQMGSVAAVPTITLSSHALDQLLETSVSTLNFTIDSELMQLLAATDRSRASGANSIQSISYVDSNRNEKLDLHTYPFKSAQVSGQQQLGQKPRKPPSKAHTKRQSRGSSDEFAAPTKLPDRFANLSKTATPSKRKTAFVRGETGSGSATKFGAPSKTIIQIKCVARILNLNMFDEIRLIVRSHRNTTYHKQDNANQINPLSKELFAEADKNCASCFSLSSRRAVLVIALVIMQRIIHKLLSI